MTLPFAMHMANELLSVPVAGITMAVAAVTVAVAARWARSADDSRLPLMGVIGAFVFAAQMINFTLPGMPGTSGHLGGGVLLAILLGPAPAIVTMTAILIVQCLLFQDGGLLALGCNIINMGIIPCLLGWATYYTVLGPIARAAAWRQYLAAWIACMVGVTAGAAVVPIEAGFSHVLQVPLSQFLSVMLGVHLLISLCEGAITFAVIAYLRRVRPELLGLESAHMATAGRPIVVISLLVTLLLAGVGSWFASTLPDGLEWSYQKHSYASAQAEKVVRNDSPVVAVVDQWQKRLSPMPDYARREAPLGQVPATTMNPARMSSAPSAEKWPNYDHWRSFAGILGTMIVLGMLYGFSRRMGRPVNG